MCFLCRLYSGGEENRVVTLRGVGEGSRRASRLCAQRQPAGRGEDCQLYVPNVSLHTLWIYAFGDLTCGTCANRYGILYRD